MKQKYKVYINNEVKTITENWKDFCSRYTLIEAAGGIVYNNQDELLMIFRNGKWDLPKGKLEQGETKQQCAIREVEEECGVSGLNIIKQVPNTYHTYFDNDESILKKTYWFLMKTDYSGNLEPQIKEGITKVCWTDKGQKLIRKMDTYANIRDLIEYI